MSIAIAVLVPLVCGLIAFIVQTLRLSASAAKTQAALDQVTALQKQAAVDATTIETMRAQLVDAKTRSMNQLSDLQQRLAAAENALVKVAPPSAVGDFARRVLSGQAEAPAAAPAASPAGVPGKPAASH